MKKTMVLSLCLLVANSGFALESSVATAYADIYADELVEQFDRELDQALILKKNPLESLTYAKLQAARAYKENLEHTQKSTSASTSVAYPLFQSKIYEVVKEQINQDAQKLFQAHEDISREIEKSKLIEPPYAYPSVSAKGNLFGNDFPRNVWALTFDDGPRNVRTEKIIDNLLARNSRATFFMLTKEAKRFTSAAKDVRDRGMDIASHSYDHANLPKVSSANLKYQITDAKNDLEKLLGIDIQFFRLPYGAGVHNARIRKLIADNNMIHVFWNIDTLDWQDRNPQSVLRRAIKLMNATPNHSGIILFHDIHESTIEASRLVMDYLLEKGNKLCSLKEIVDGLNGEAQNCY